MPHSRHRTDRNALALGIVLGTFLIVLALLEWVA